MPDLDGNHKAVTLSHAQDVEYKDFTITNNLRKSTLLPRVVFTKVVMCGGIILSRHIPTQLRLPYVIGLMSAQPLVVVNDK